MSCNFDKFELEEKLLLVCLYNFEFEVKNDSEFVYILYTLSWGRNDFESTLSWGAKRL